MISEAVFIYIYIYLFIYNEIVHVYTINNAFYYLDVTERFEIERQLESSSLSKVDFVSSGK